MTIAICVRVGDGVVLAADSVTAMKAGQGIGQIFDGARKLLRPQLDVPVGLVTFGQGTIEGQSIAGLAITLRERLSLEGQWALNPEAYTVDEVAQRVRDFYAERIQLAVNHGNDPHSPVGFLVAGYSSGSEVPECWEIELTHQGVSKFSQIDPNEESSLCYRGFTDALDRLTKGAARPISIWLDGLGAAKELLLQQSKLTLVRPEMPVAEAIKLADWLSGIAIGAMHFAPGAEIIGGSVDLARITRDDGFVWVRQQSLPVQPQAVDALLP